MGEWDDMLGRGEYAEPTAQEWRRRALQAEARVAELTDPTVQFRVTLIESDSWSGQKYFHRDFDTFAEAEKHIEEVNAKNTSPVAPDYYVQAKKSIKAVRLIEITKTPKPQPMRRGSTDQETCALNGWQIGDVLIGEPILDEHGKQIERGVSIMLTYFTRQGEVLAVREPFDEGDEHTWSLDSREWRKDETFSK